MSKKLVLSAILALTINQQAFAITLTEANQLALQNDPNWKAAVARYEAQAQNLGIAKSARRTQIDLNGSHIQSYGPQMNNGNTRVSLDLSKTLYNGSQRAGIKKAEVMHDVYAVELEIQKEAELNKVTTAYLEGLKKQEIYKLSKEEVSILEAQVKRAQNSVDAGVAPKNEQLDFKAQLDAALSSFMSSEMEINSAKIDLESIVGTAVNSLETNLSLSSGIVNNTDRNYWIESANTNNLKLQRTKLLVLAADFNMAEKSKMNGPVVTGVASVGNQYSGGNGGYGNGTNGYVGVQVRIPLGGKAKSSYTAQARSEQEAAFDDQQAQLLQITTNINRLISSLQLDQRIIAAKKKQVLSASEALKTSMISFQSGHLNSLDIVAAQRAVGSAQREYIIAKYDAATRVLKLLEVSGKLTIENIEKIERQLD